MDSLADYVQWMGDYPISMTGFQDADALILCSLSYFDFSPVFAVPSENHSLRDCLASAGELKVMITGGDDGYSELLRLAAASRRYGELGISDYCDISRQDPPLQFSALCFHGDGFSFLAYRGTDNSLSGWKEDFNISFTRTEAQWLALRYAEECVAPGRDWYICGHSKGANLALYAACLLSGEKRDAIRHLYLFDGPGFCPEVMDLKLIERVNAKTTQILPFFCIVGKLFAPKITDTRIIRSSAYALMQHGIITWGIDHGKLALAENHDPTSLILSEAMDAWITNIRQEDRKAFIDEFFDALSANGAETLDDIQAGGRESLEAIYRRLIESSALTRRTLADLPRYAFRAQLDDLRRRLGAELENRLRK